MNKTEIALQIKETEEKLANLRKELEKPEYPKIEDSKPGDKLENGCIVIHKMEDLRMALIAAPKSTEVYCQWSKDFNSVFEVLEREGFNRSQWFIPNVEQLRFAYKNCQDKFVATNYWSSTGPSSTHSCSVNFYDGYQSASSKANTNCVRAFSLVSY